MTKRPSLGFAASKTPSAAEPAAEVIGANKTTVPPSRQGKVQLAGYFDVTAKRQIDVFAAREGRSLQSIMEEMYDDFCAKHKMHRIADMSA